MVTLIPNMRGALGHLVRRWNPVVFALHNPHSLRELAAAHVAAGMDIVRSSYLCSNNFGILSSCVTPARRGAWGAYVALTRMSKLVWFFEAKFGDFPRSQALSPYLYVIARRRAA
jgi:hypothetical protein